MKAIRFDGPGDADVVKLTEESRPELRPYDLMIRVYAAGVNRADILQREGYYGDAPDFGDSTIPGLEVAGEILSVGERVSMYKPGDRVMAVVGGGGYAEYARIPEAMAMAIPASLTYEQAAAIPEVFVTAHEALIHLGELRPGDWALIHAAAGGVGSAAVMLANALGAKSIFTASGVGRIERVRELGGTVGVDYRNDDFLEAALRATEGRGVQVVVDFVGAPYLERNLRALAPGGRLVQVGLLAGGQASLPMDLLLHRYLRIIGTVMKSRSFEEKVAMTGRFRDHWLQAFSSGHLAPVIDRVFPLQAAADAHRHMEASGNVGKIVLSLA